MAQAPRSFQLGEGTIVANGDASARGTPAAGELWIEVIFASQPKWDATDKWIDVLAKQSTGDAALGKIASVLSSPVTATPSVSLFCTGRIGETIGGFGNGLLVASATNGNVAGTTIMSLCVPSPSTGPNDGDLVQPFVGERAFAYAVTEPIIHSLIQNCWARADFPKQMLGPVSFQYEQKDGTAASGSADVKVTLDDIQEIGWEPLMRPSGDALAFRGNHTTTILNLLDATGTAFPKDQLGDLTKPITEPYDFVLFPFDPDEDSDVGTQQSQNLRRGVSSQVLIPILQPFTNPLFCTEIIGFSSASAGVVISRSNPTQ
jgi:hypothetical protein